MNLRTVVEQAMGYTGNLPYGGKIQETHWGVLEYQVLPRAGGYLPPLLEVRTAPHFRVKYDLGDSRDLHALGV